MIQKASPEKVASGEATEDGGGAVSAMPAGERAFRAESTASAREWEGRTCWVGGSENSREAFAELEYREWRVERTDDGETEAQRRGKTSPELTGISDRCGEGTFKCSLHTYCAPGRLRILTHHQPSTISFLMWSAWAH